MAILFILEVAALVLYSSAGIRTKNKNQVFVYEKVFDI